MKPERCRHLCPCGAILVCGSADKCGAGPFWRCFACEQDHYDDYVSRLAADKDTPQEIQTHEPQQAHR